MKQIIYDSIPEFDQATQYVIQKEPIEEEDCIRYGVEIHELPPQEENEEEWY